MPSRRPLRLTSLLPLLPAALAVAQPSLAWDGAPPEATAFVAMADDRFAAMFPQPGGLVVRFARDQFTSEDAAEVDFGIGYPELTWDPASDTLLLYRGYEGSGYLVAYSPEGRELYRMPTGEPGDGIALVPGARLFAMADGPDLMLVECRTGVTVRRMPVAGPDGRVLAAMPLDADQLLVDCVDDQGNGQVLLDWRTGVVAWRGPAARLGFVGRGLVAADSARVFSLSGLGYGNGVTISSRSRRDGATLAEVDVPANYCWIYAVPGDRRLLLLSGSYDDPGRLELLDPDSLVPAAEIDLPAGLRVRGAKSMRALGNGRLLIEGDFMPGSGPLAQEPRAGRQLLVDLTAVPPRARIFSGLLSVDPNGRGWLLGTERREVVGEVPWLEQIDLDVAAQQLPLGVRRSGREITTAGGPALRIQTGVARPGPADAAALHALLEKSDLCFIGTIASTATHCLGRFGPPDDGVIEADFAIEELLFGPDSASRVFADGFDMPGCVAYDTPTRPAPERFVPGRRYLVVARWRDDAFVVAGPGLFALDPDAPVADRQGGFAVPDPAATARAFAARIDLESQWERADAVVRLGAVEDRSLCLAGFVMQVYKGDDAMCRVEVCDDPGGFHTLMWIVAAGSRERRAEGDLVLFLKRRDANRYELLEGARSVLRRQRDGTWARPGGLREPRAAGVLDDR